jgi:AcrR family transcriptional regulator
MASTDTRRRILDAALACFIEDGYEQATIARIRQRSGTSNGALFHHFASKEAIADALYVEAIASFQHGLWELLASKPRSPRAMVRETIAHLLRWIEQHPDLARLIYLRGNLGWDSPAGAELLALNRDLAAAYRKWMAPLVDAGEIRPASMLVISAIVSGPAHAIAQRWLAGQIATPLTAFVDELSDAAWAGLRGTQVRTRPARYVPPAGRLRLELIDDDGSVLAQGQATARLRPLRPADSGTT